MSTLIELAVFLTYQTFVTNLHLLRAEGPLAHHVVLNHIFELLINTTKLFSYF